MDLSVRKRQVYSDKIQNETRMNLSEQTDGLSNWLCKKKSSKKVCKIFTAFQNFAHSDSVLLWLHAPLLPDAIGQWYSTINYIVY